MSRPVPIAPSASVTGGLWFVFEQSGGHVALWVSSLTGKEELYVNGTLAATRRKIALSSVHEVEINGVKYTVSLSTRNLRRGVFECVLFRTGVAVAGWETEYVSHRRWQQTAGTVVGAALLTYLGIKWALSFMWVAVGIAVVACLSYALFSRQSGYVIRPMVMSASAA